MAISLKKITCLFLGLITFSIFTPVVSATAKTNANTDYDMEQVYEVADMLEFMYEEATIKDESGNVVDLDFDKIRGEYGDSEDLQKLEAIIEDEKQSQSDISTFSWGDCMLEAVADFLGVSAVGSLISGGIMALFKKRAWVAAAKLIIKTFGAQFTVAALAGTLAYFSVKCY